MTEARHLLNKRFSRARKVPEYAKLMSGLGCYLIFLSATRVNTAIWGALKTGYCADVSYARETIDKGVATSIARQTATRTTISLFSPPFLSKRNTPTLSCRYLPQ